MVSKFLNIGTSKTLDFEEEFRVRLLNAFSIVFMLVMLFFVLHNIFFTKLYLLAIVDIGVFLVAPLIVWFQHKKKYEIAKFIFFLLLHFIIIYASIFLRPGYRIEYFYLISIMLILILLKKFFWAYFLIFVDSMLLFVPQVIFKAYPENTYPYANTIILTVSTVCLLSIFILIQRQFRVKLNVQNQKLEALNKEKNDLMSIVAHDLKTPLAQINGLISLFELEGDHLKKEQLELIEKIKGVTDTQNKQISSFLDVETFDNKVVHQEFDIVKCTKKIIEEASTLAFAKNIRIHEKYASTNIVYMGSEEECTKIISNLFSNAIKYSYSNSAVTIKIEQQKGHLLFSIKDEGQGFQKKELDQVFAKNRTLSAKPTSGEEASGVGLYIVKKYVEKMDGKVWLKSEKGEGSTFYVRLPQVS